MAFAIRRVAYYHTTVKNSPGEGHAALAGLAAAGVDLLAFTAVPFGPDRTQLTLFPDDAAAFEAAARHAAMTFDGPHPALLVNGDDELGALAGVHSRLAKAGVNVVASSGVGDGKGRFGYVVYVRQEDIGRAIEALAA
jgi:hypothetical protein